MKPLSFTDPIHIIHGHSAGGSVYQLSKKPRPDIVVLTDSLLRGPSSVDRERHGQGRVTYWQSENDRRESPRRRKRPRFDIDHDRRDVVGFSNFAAALASFPDDRPIVVWSAPNMSDRLSLWWAFDAIDHLGLDRRRVWLGQPHADHEENDDSLLLGLGTHHPTAFLSGFATLQPLSARLLRAGSLLWRRFAGPSPALFEEACLKRQEIYPEIPKFLHYYARLFPSLTRGRTRRMQVSFLDQFILNGLSTADWRLPIDVLHGNKQQFLFLMNFLPGDLWLPSRLLDWAEHEREDPLVLGRDERTGVSSFTRRSYLLTARGETVRRRGMASITDAPRLHIGGCEVYDPRRPWVSLVNKVGAHAKFQELGR